MVDGDLYDELGRTPPRMSLARYQLSIIHMLLYYRYDTIAGKVTSGLWGNLNCTKNVKPILITMYNDNLVQWRPESSKKKVEKKQIFQGWPFESDFDALSNILMHIEYWFQEPQMVCRQETLPRNGEKVHNNKTFTEQTWCWCPHNLKEPSKCLFVGRIFVHKTFQGMSWILRASPI